MFRDMRILLEQDIDAQISKDERVHSSIYEINKRLESLFNFESDTVTSHMLWKIYANKAYITHGSKAKSSESWYVSDVLGHNPKNHNSAAHYTTVGFY